MALYLTEWFLGEEELSQILWFYWEPHLILNRAEDNTGVLGFSLISREGEDILYDIVPVNSRNEFFERYHYSMNILYQKIGLPEFFTKLLKTYTSGTEIDMDIFNKMNYEFCTKLIDYDFAEVVPLYRRLISLIFFNSWDLIKHYKILVDPQSIE